MRSLNGKGYKIASALVSVIFLTLVVTEVRSEWWFMGSSDALLNQVKNTNVPCAEIRSLSRSQRTLCERYRDHLQYVGEGAKEGIGECQWQFKNQRWNCTTLENKRNTVRGTSTLFGKVIDIGSAETAFTYAISAAAVVHKIARACKDSRLKSCGCSDQARPSGLGPIWEWGGCGDNTEYAYGFAREFIDARERDVASPRDAAPSKARKAMNMHNNEAGRLAVVRSARPTCKCHGVSGSCSLNTCWLQVPSFRVIGDKLKSQFQNAVEVKLTKRHGLKSRRKSDPNPSSSQLVFIDSSPDYCTPNKKTGVIGTKGRFCNGDSSEADGCGFLCCGRGYNSYTEEIVERCKCKFQWCCQVRCQKCRRRVTRHVCR